MARMTLIQGLRHLSLGLLCAGLIGACSMLPPVQEMSDARQAIRAAIEADAQKHAPANLQLAQSYLDQATESLESRSYEQARREALAAREQAIQARDRAIARTVIPLP